MKNSEHKRSELDKFFGDQLSRWTLACDNFRALKGVQVKEFPMRGLKVKLQHNPARIVSSAAKTDSASLKARACFLCRENRPAEQFNLTFEGRKGKSYDILVNPYPIFPNHLVIALASHREQSIWSRYVDMLDLARNYQGYTFFYNGPRCGASAPDHHHFQATLNGRMPLELDVDGLLDMAVRYPQNAELQFLASVRDAQLYWYNRFARGIFALRARTAKSMAKLFYRLLDCVTVPEGEKEPLFNLITYYKSGEYRSIVIFRTGHRSHHYFSDGPDHLTMSPGCADVAGMFIVPVKEDFEKITPELLCEMMDEVTLDEEAEQRIIRKLTRTQPLLEVGILSAPEIAFEMISDGAGVQRASYREGRIDYNGVLYDELFFEASTPSTMFAEPSFLLHDVVIGKGFHWERRETQKFAGSLKIIVCEGKLTAVNLVGVEDYLVSVISSEMNSRASLEFLKAHAVISRSWVMSRIAARRGRKSADGNPAFKGLAFQEKLNSTPSLVTMLDSQIGAEKGQEDGYVRWYGQDEHRCFDVCADDHCQRYQGLTRVIGENARKVIDQTWGQLLCYGGEICDARFSKSCGGVMELFSTCWEDRDYPYLQALPDTPDHDPAGEPFCLVRDRKLLSQLLNDYDLEGFGANGWDEEYTLEELSSLIESKSGRHIGRLEALTALEKGPSGRVKKLLVQGSEGHFTVGKELEIRRILSRSHLKSSDFEAIFEDGRVRFHGKGWGHGVGLCQIGAAVMAERGYDYRAILQHYYPGSEIIDRQ